MSNQHEVRIAMAERVRCTASTVIPTRWGSFRALALVRDTVTASWSARQEAAVAVCLGDLRGEAPLVRVHPERVTRELLASTRHYCSAGLDRALHSVAREGRGLAIYEHQEGLGIGLMESLAQSMQAGRDPNVEFDEALDESGTLDRLLPAAIVRALGISCVRLPSTESGTLRALLAAGIDVWGDARLH